MKKPRTAKQLANDERLRQMAAQRKAQDNGGTPAPEPRPGSQPTLNPGKDEDAQETISVEDYYQLKQQMEELKSNLQFMASLQKPQGPQAGKGGLVGTIDRYIIDPAHYPSPIERLRNEPQLQRFAFKDNYELEFQVTPVRYQTIDNIWQQEPRFTLELNRVVFDEDTGERTNGRYTVCRLIMHEDPDAAVVVARENGIPVDDSNEAEFLNEMRYIRFRDWLMESFLPPKPAQAKQNKKETVIGNKLVEFFEINSETSEVIPFSELTKKA